MNSSTSRGRVEGVEEHVALALAHRAPGRFRECGARGIRREVVLVPAQHVGPDPAQRVLVEPHRVPADERPEHRRRTARRASTPARDSSRRMRSDPLIAATSGGSSRVGGHAVHEVTEGTQRHATPRRGSAAPVRCMPCTRPTVPRRGCRRSRTAAAPSTGGMPRGAARRRSCRCRAPGDLGDPSRRGSDRLVLVALDRRDDVAHLAATAAGQRRDEGAVAEHDDVRRRLGHHEVVLGADDGRALAPQDTAAEHAHRVDGGRAVERRRCGRPPVDDERFVVVVAHAEAADVADLPLRGGTVFAAQVQAAEHQPLVLLLDHRPTSGGRVDEGVALEEPGHLLVADVTRAARAPSSEAVGLDVGGSQARLLQLGVDPVDVGLLVRELTGDVR